MSFSRRGFLKGLAAVTGAAVGARVVPGFVGNAFAATEPTTVVMLHLVGGYNSIFCSADSLVGRFGVAAGNFTVLGNGLAVDNTFANGLSAFAKSHMAAIGVRHGISSHPAARRALWSNGANNAALQLASAIGGTASIKAAVVGGDLIAEAPRTAVNGVSFQSIRDMKSTIDAMGGGVANPRIPDRTVALSGLSNAEKMSQLHLAKSPESLSSLREGYAAAVETLKQPVKTFNFADLSTAYTLNNSTAVNTFKSKMAAAELMSLAGANVVSVFDGGWDTHGDRTGTTVRNKMTSYVVPAINTFVNRMVADPNRNVVLCIMGDFARSLPGSDHQPNLSVTVIGKFVKQGTTGKVDANVRLPTSAPGINGLWAYLAAVTKTPGNMFGANPHNLVL
jgi:hypothetical protein